MPDISPDQQAPRPSFSTTYKRADGELVGNDHGWVTDLEFFEDWDEPVELVEETWERTSVRTFWLFPTTFYDCDLPDCDEDAVHWVQLERDGTWEQRCGAHRG